jgi:subtilisin family serine protease
MMSNPRLAVSLAIAAVVALLALGLLPGSGPAPLEAQGGVGIGKAPLASATGEAAVPGELIVKFKAGASRSDQVAAIQGRGAAVVQQLLLPDFTLVRVPAGKEREAAAQLEADPRVELVEPNAIGWLDFVPNDQNYSYQWHLPQVQMPQAWDLADGAGVTVAIIDTGVAYENYGGFKQAPDLACRTFVHPYDFVNNDSHANDDQGHGTHVTGTVAQCTNNGFTGSGVAGVAFGAKIMPVKVCSAAGQCYASVVANGIVWATNNGADVINLSLGGSYTSTEKSAIDYALAHDVVVVAAAGNGGLDEIGDPVLNCPACYPGVIAVGATDFRNFRTPYSNYGTGVSGHTLDLVAPGGDVYRDDNHDGEPDGVLQETYTAYCIPGGNFVTFAACWSIGTSMAAPHVAGAAAILLSANPSLTRTQVASCLTSTALDLGAAGYDLEYGYGLIQVRDAIDACVVNPRTDTPVPADYDGNGTADPSAWRPSDGTWHVLGQPAVQWGATADIPVPDDYDGDPETEMAVWRPSDGKWYVYGGSPVQWGVAGDIPVPGEYDSDPETDMAVWRPSDGKWWVLGNPSVQWGMAGDIPVPGDYDGDGKTEMAVWRPSDGKWYVYGGSPVQWGVAGDIPVPGEYDSDPETDMAVWRPSDGKWYVQGQTSVQWGVAGDIPVPGDYDGDGMTDPAVWRPSDGVWYIRGQSSVQWGRPVPRHTPGDYDGDRKTDRAVWRPSNGTWYVLGMANVKWGASGDVPVPGDYDGDEKVDRAIWRPSNSAWYVPGEATEQWGVSSDIPVPGDYIGDGKTDRAVWRPSDGGWYVQGEPAVQWGAAGDIPVPGDYNGDGETELAVWRPSDGRWYVRGEPAVQWGATGDIPVPGDYDGDGTTDMAVWRPSDGRWYVKGQSPYVQWGVRGDMPVPGDYDGDGTTDNAVWRPSNGKWYVRGMNTVQWGASGDVPVTES